jgi:hemerythrin-like metal-binding protein
MAKKFIWTEEYSVSVKEMDEQHKQFIQICNDLLDLTEKDSLDQNEALSKIMKLGDYASYHLGAEEDLFTKTDYPDAEMHIKIHEEFRNKTKDFINMVREENSDTKKIIEEIAQFTGEWLINHIKGIDKKYSEYLNKAGIR